MKLFFRKKIVLPKASGKNWWPAPPDEEGWIPFTLGLVYPPPLGIVVQIGRWNCEKGAWYHTGMSILCEEDLPKIWSQRSEDIGCRYWRMTGIGKMQMEEATVELEELK